MPHFTIEYSADLDAYLDMGQIVECVRKAAVETAIFPLGGIRVRAIPCKHVAIADGRAGSYFIDMLLRLGEGRDVATRKNAGDHIFKALSDQLDPLFLAGMWIALSFDMQINDPATSWKRNSIHDFLKQDLLKQELVKTRPLMDKTNAFQDNRDRAAPLLEALKRDGIGNIIDGKIVPSSSGETFETQSPIDKSVLAHVARGTVEDIDRAAMAAQRAFKPWRDMPATQRKKILHKVADAIEARADDIAVLECIDTGQAHRFMAKAAIRAAENFRFFADKCADAQDGLSTPGDEHWNISTRVPIGPVGVITPWNTPFMLSTWKIAPALASGCTVVHKPAEWSPVTADLLARLAKDAGLPDGVLNTVHGMGEDAGKALTEHPAIKAIAFVGETSTGAAIMAQGAKTLKRVHFELGGKNPVIVFDDADMARALDAVVFMIYSLNGERCTSSSRLLIQASVADVFIEKLIARVKALKVGHPLDPATEVGPLIHQRHLDKVCSYVDIARDDGATIAVGGEAHNGPGGGHYVQPTLVIGARADMRVAQEEVFGPFLTVIPFADEAEAIDIANATPYGLTGYVWTGDMGRALRVADALDAGMIWLNSENVRHLPTPFGGMKNSGIGRDGGDYSFDFYMETKHVSLARGTHKIQKLGV